MSITPIYPEILKALREYFDNKLINVIINNDQVNVTIRTEFQQAIMDGKAFSVGDIFTGVSSGADRYVYFENPSDSNVKVHMIVIWVVTLAELHIRIYRDNTVISAGDQIEPINLNFSSNNRSKIIVYKGGSYSEGRYVKGSVCPGGSHIRAVGGAVEVGEQVIIPPGNNFLIKITNASASSTDFSFAIVWWEEDLTNQ